MAAILMITMLTGCVGSGRSKLDPVVLPKASACMEPVPMPPLKKGDNAKQKLAEHRLALGKANKNLRCSKEWYEGVRKKYSVY